MKQLPSQEEIAQGVENKVGELALLFEGFQGSSQKDQKYLDETIEKLCQFAIKVLNSVSNTFSQYCRDKKFMEPFMTSLRKAFRDALETMNSVKMGFIRFKDIVVSICSDVCTYAAKVFANWNKKRSKKRSNEEEPDREAALVMIDQLAIKHNIKDPSMNLRKALLKAMALEKKTALGLASQNTIEGMTQFRKLIYILANHGEDFKSITLGDRGFQEKTPILGGENKVFEPVLEQENQVEAASKIQAGVRRMQATGTLSKHVDAATKIQAGVRRMQATGKLSKQDDAATKIQDGVRRMQKLKQQKQKLKQQKHSRISSDLSKKLKEQLTEAKATIKTLNEKNAKITQKLRMPVKKVRKEEKAELRITLQENKNTIASTKAELRVLEAQLKKVMFPQSNTNTRRR